MKELTHYKQKLLNERKTIIQELSSIGIIKDKRHPDDWEALPEDIDTSRADPNEVADKIEMYEGNSDIVRKLETQLKAIDSALSKIKENTFGICDVGGEEIEEDRLEANPAARTCKKHMNIH